MEIFMVHWMEAPYYKKMECFFVRYREKVIVILFNFDIEIVVEVVSVFWNKFVFMSHSTYLEQKDRMVVKSWRKYILIRLCRVNLFAWLLVLL